LTEYRANLGGHVRSLERKKDSFERIAADFMGFWAHLIACRFHLRLF